MKLNELNNEEIVFLYIRNHETLSVVENIIKEKMATETIEILDYGIISVSRTLTDEDVKEIQDGDYYKNLININEKLEPIAQMIEDVDPDMYERVKKSLNVIF